MPITQSSIADTDTEATLRELQQELEQLRERMFELEEMEISRVTDEKERFDSLQVLEEYARQLEDSRDKLARLFGATSALYEAKTTKEILQKIADTVHDSGWGSISVVLFKNWEVIESCYSGCTPEDIAFLESNRRPAEQRASTFGPDFERFKVSRSYFVPADKLHEVIDIDHVCPGRREVQPGDSWDPMDLTYIPLYGTGGRVIGCINCDDPVNGKRPTSEDLFYLELFSDLAARKIELSRLIEQQLRTAESLRESEAKYRALFSRSVDGYFLMDDLFRDCNQRACDIFGCARQDIIGNSPVRFSPEFQPDGRLSSQAAADYISSAMNGTPQHFEWIHKRKDGTLIDCEVSLSAVEISGEALILAIVRDVSDRKQSERAIQESEERFRVLADGAPVMMRVFGADKQGSYFNRAWREFTGHVDCPESEASWERDLHQEDANSVRTVFDQAFDEQQEYCLEYRLRRFDGTYRWVIENGAPRFSPTGDFIGYLTTTVDITERKREMEFHETVGLVSKMLLSCEALHTVYAELPELLAKRWNIPYCAIELHDSLTGDLVCAGSHGDPEPPGARVPAHASPAGDAVLSGLPTRRNFRDGEDEDSALQTMQRLDLRSWICVPFVLKGRVLGAITLADHAPIPDAELMLKSLEFIADSLAQTSERRRAEDENVRLAAFQKENPNVAISCDHKGNVTYINPKGVAVLRELNVHLFPGLLPLDHKPLIRRCVAEQNAISDITTQVGPRVISWTYHFVPSVNMVHLIGVDVTERRCLEQELKERDSRRRAIVDSALDCIIITDQDGRIVEFNPAAEAVFGFPSDEICGRPLVGTLIPPQHHAAHLQGMHQFLATAEQRLIGRRIETTALRKDGSEFPIELTISTGEVGGRQQFTAFIRDISERRLAECAAAEKDRTLHDLVNALPEIVGVFDLRTFVLQSFNNMMSKELGYSEAEITGMGAQFVRTLVHPEDVSALVNELERLGTLPVGATAEIRFRMRTKSGPFKVLDARLTAMSSGAEGKTELIVGVARVIEESTRRD